jgi:uncharacterized phage protein gp47/JayE
MPLTSIASLQTLEQQTLAFIRTRFPGRATGRQNFLGKIARVVAMALFGLQRTAEAIDKDASPTDKTSSFGLDLWAFIFGVPSNVGGYGRNQATAAAGGQALITGTPGIVVQDGLLLTAPDGVTQVKLSGSVTIPAVGNFVAVTKGSAGNLSQDSTLTWVSPPAGCDPAVTLSSALIGAIDLESNAGLLARIYARLQKPPKGGAEVDYVTWTLQASGGVLRGYPYPLRGGTGTVHLVLATQGATGQGRRPQQAMISQVGNAVVGTAATQGLRPCTADGFLILSPYTNPPGMYLSPAGLAIKLRMVPSAPKYAFDWQSGGNPLVVASYNPAGGANGAPAVTLTAPVPQSLAAALAANARPRLQIGSAGPVVFQAVAATAVDSTNTVLTLSSPPSVVPATGDAIYPWGPMATLIANQVRNYVDGLGPSRQSGYADPTDPWEDTCAIARLEQVALNATDTDGSTRFASNVAAPATINGVSQDIEAQDNSNGVELLWASSIVVCD